MNSRSIIALILFSAACGAPTRVPADLDSTNTVPADAASVDTPRATTTGGLVSLASSSTETAHWRFDEQNGSTAADADGNRNGTLTGGRWVNSAKNGTGALEFDNTADLESVEISGGFTLDDDAFSTSGWFRFDELPSEKGENQVLIRRSHQGAPYFSWDIIAVANDHVQFRVYDASGSQRIAISSDAPMGADRWIQIGTTMDDTGLMSLYINGVRQQHRETVPNRLQGTGILSLGGRSGRSLTGSIDDVCMFGASLGRSEMESLTAGGQARGCGDVDITRPTMAPESIEAAPGVHTFDIATSESTTCRYGTERDVWYGQMPQIAESDDGYVHQLVVTVPATGSTTHYAKCRDAAGNTSSPQAYTVTSTGTNPTPPTPPTPPSPPTPPQADTVYDYDRYAQATNVGHTVMQDVVYGAGKVDYDLRNANGGYDYQSQIDLDMDLFLPNTAPSDGLRAAIIMIPSGGRSGCRNGSTGPDACDVSTQVNTGANPPRVSVEGTTFNHFNNSNARRYADRGIVVASINTRYTYQLGQYENQQNWYDSPDGTPTGGASTLLEGPSNAHLEYLATDVKRALRHLVVNAEAYNIDPRYIFISGGSGGGKMASVASWSRADFFTSDDPANVDLPFEVAHNNWSASTGAPVVTPAFRGAVLLKSNANHKNHFDLMDQLPPETDSFFLWSGTADWSILHGHAEAMEEKCEVTGFCHTEFYSLYNKTHSGSNNTSAAQYPHTDGGQRSVYHHAYDFMVNTIATHEDPTLPELNLHDQVVSFDESSGQARIVVRRTGDTSRAVSFTLSVDQSYEVTDENLNGGTYANLTRHIAKSDASDGVMLYAQGTGYAYEADSLSRNSDAPGDVHNSGQGNGNALFITDASYNQHDFIGGQHVLTIPAGSSQVVFDVPLINDNRPEDNECFKVRIVNATGATVGNSVESYTILDDDRAQPATSSFVCGNH